MRRCRWYGLAALASVVLALAPGGAGAASAPPSSPRYGISVGPARFDIAVPAASAPLQLGLNITDHGTQPVTVSAHLADLYITNKGAYQAVPLGSTPYSLAKTASLDVSQLKLAPLPDLAATGHVTITYQPDLTPRYGVLVVRMQLPPSVTTGRGFGVSVNPEILVPLIFAPAGALPGTLAPSVTLRARAAGLATGALRAWWWLDSVIPSPPHLADHGPVAAQTQVDNRGNSYARAYTQYTFSSANMLDWLPGPLRERFGIHDTVFLTAQPAPAATLPGGQATIAATTETSSVGGSALDTTPWVGLVRVHAQTRLRLADASSAPVTSDGWVLVLPWKELLLLLLAYAAWRGGRYLMARRRQRGGKVQDDSRGHVSGT